MVILIGDFDYGWCLSLFQLDDWVLCRIYKKRPMAKSLEQQFAENSHTQMDMVTSEVPTDQNNMLNFPRTCSLTHLFEMEYFGSITQLLSDSSYNNSTFDFQSNPSNGAGGSIERFQFGEMPNQYADLGKYQVNQNQQPIIVNPVFEFQ